MSIQQSRGRSIQNRLILLLLFILTPVLLIQAFIYYERFEAQRTHALQTNLEIARATGEMFKEFVNDTFRQESAIGVTLTLPRSFSVEEMNDILAKSKAEYPAVRHFAWANPQGRIVATDLPDAIGFDISHSPYYEEIAAGKDRGITDLYHSRTTGKLVFTIARAVRDNAGALQGIVVAMVDPERLDRVMRLDRAAGGTISLIDGKGMLVYSYPHIEVSWEDRNWLKTYPFVEDTLKGKETSTITAVGREDEKRIIALTPTPFGWIAGAGRREGDVIVPILASLARDTLLFFSVSIAAFFIALAISRKIADPVKALRAHALALGRGEYSEQVQIKHVSELQDLADAFNTMAEKVQCREMALRESEEDLTRAQAVAHTGSWRLDVRRNELRWSDENHRIFGIARDTPLTYEMFLTTVHPEDRESVDRKWTAALLGEPYDIEHRIVVGDAVKWVREKAELEFGTEGVLLGGFGTTQDITERKRMEEELKRARDELELRVHERTAELLKATEILKEQAALLDLAHDAILVRDLDGKILYWNTGAEKAYGWDKEEAMGKIARTLLCTQFPKPLNEIMQEVFACGQWEGELCHTTHSGAPLIEDSRWAIQKDSSGNPSGILVINRDITERKKAEEQIKSTLAKLEESNQALQDFASIASHDLQEPLRKVISFGRRLKQKHGASLGEEGNDYLERMLSATNRMQSLLESLLDYARITTEAEPFEEVELSALISEVLADLEVRIQTTGGEVQVGDLPVMLADPVQMRQLFQNLIGNALKFHKEGEKPIVKVHSTAIDSRTFRIVVEDNGIGFDERHLNGIFTPFQRLHGRSSPYEGTGMGLAICKKIVERHGGSITARSTPGQGTAFIVTLPVKQTGGHSDRPGSQR